MAEGAAGLTKGLQRHFVAFVGECGYFLYIEVAVGTRAKGAGHVALL